MRTVARKDNIDKSSKLVMITAFAAAFAARKVITLAWRAATGKQPPAHPEDPQVSLAEALGWAIITGVGVDAVRVLATRAVSRKVRRTTTAEIDQAS
jgi:hypothetical protein